VQLLIARYDAEPRLAADHRKRACGSLGALRLGGG